MSRLGCAREWLIEVCALQSIRPATCSQTAKCTPLVAGVAPGAPRAHGVHIGYRRPSMGWQALPVPNQILMMCRGAD
eukprot:7094485-Pyramimonas_sp.AAC.1